MVEKAVVSLLVDHKGQIERRGTQIYRQLTQISSRNEGMAELISEIPAVSLTIRMTAACTEHPGESPPRSRARVVPIANYTGRDIPHPAERIARIEQATVRQQPRREQQRGYSSGHARRCFEHGRPSALFAPKDQQRSAGHAVG